MRTVKNKKFLFIALVILVAAIFAGCSTDIEYGDAVATGIALDGMNKIDNYVAGDELNIEGASLFVTYSDGTIQSFPLTKEMLSGYDMGQAELGKVITVNYAACTTTFKINVYPSDFASVTLGAPPDKLNYIEGESVRAAGAFIQVHYDGGKVVPVNVTDKMLEAYDNLKIGKQQIFISYHGYDLFFEVTFQKKTVTAVKVLREPYQNSVFLNYGDRIDIAGMRLKLTYDNGMSPEVSAVDYRDSIEVYLNDRSVGGTTARVMFFPADYETEITYDYLGNSLVSVGEYVYPDMNLASNLQMDNTVSKSYGVVKYAGDGKIVVNTVVVYDVAAPSVKVGQIIINEEALGKHGNDNVLAKAGGGKIISVESGKVTVQTAPVGTFLVNVIERSYERMEILKYPVTKNFANDIDRIIQGDRLDLTTGMVRVYYNNGESRDFPMNSSYIKVVNSEDDMRRTEIKNFQFLSVDDVTALPSGRYELKYETKHSYNEKDINIVVTVVDENGKDIYVQDNRWVSLGTATNYTVSVTASYFDVATAKTLVTECAYQLATTGAGSIHQQLDISAAGRHKLVVVYGGVSYNSINFEVNVIQRYPESITLVNDNISNRTFYKGATIPLTNIQYFITYNNGDEGAYTGVTQDMLVHGYSLVCNEITNSKKIIFMLPGSDVYSIELTCSVEAQPIKNVAFATDPTDVFLTAPATESNHVDLTGGILRIYYQNGTIRMVGGTEGVSLKQLLDNTSGERITLRYTEDVQIGLTPEDIYQHGKYYTGTLTYFDSDGAKAETEFKYYVLQTGIESIKANARQEYFKREYVQSEDWDVSGITIIVKYPNGTNATINATREMVYQSSTDVVGTNIPLKFRYLGKTDETSLTINVIPRTEVGLDVAQNGKDMYFTTDRALDLSGYRFKLFFNAGAPADVVGITEFVGSREKAGWWYEIFDTNGNPTEFRRVGDKEIRLYHTTVFETQDGVSFNYVETSVYVTVKENQSGITSVTYDDTSLGVYQGLNVLASTAKGWELFLHEYDPNTGIIAPKYLTVTYSDGTVGYVTITSAMLDYSKDELTTGYRKVTIQYRSLKCQAFVLVRNAILSKIEVEKNPCSNFIAGSELTLDGGVLKLTYEVKQIDGSFIYDYKYLSMSANGIVASGFNSNISQSQDSVKQEITLRYKDKQTSYSVMVFNKQNISFRYQNTIFFYGNTKPASAIAQQFIPEFDLPSSSDIKLWYVSSEHIIPEADFATYLLSNLNANPGDFIKVKTSDGKYAYIERKFLSAKQFIEPPARGFDYFIVMEVTGNEFYRSENYCLQKFTIIPKVIEVRSVASNENVYLMRYKANDNPTAVLYLYQNLITLVSDLVTGVISEVEMLSPNADYFEIAVYYNDTYDDVADKDKVMAIFATVESALGRVPFEADVLRISRLTREPESGINIGEYNGLVPENVSYRIVMGEMLTLGGRLELLSGKAALVEIGLGNIKTTVGTLFHKNYNVDFISDSFMVKKRAITQFGTNASALDLTTNTLTLSAELQVKVYVTHASNGVRRTLDGTELSYYTSNTYAPDSILENPPTVPGTYYVKVADMFEKDGAPITLDFILILI